MAVVLFPGREIVSTLKTLSVLNISLSISILVFEGLEV